MIFLGSSNNLKYRQLCSSLSIYPYQILILIAYNSASKIIKIYKKKNPSVLFQQSEYYTSTTFPLEKNI